MERLSRIDSSVFDVVHPSSTAELARDLSADSAGCGSEELRRRSRESGLFSSGIDEQSCETFSSSS